MDRAQYFSAQAGRTIDAPRRMKSRFAIGDVVKHRMFDFRGVIFDIDPVFANSDEWYEAIPEDIRPDRNQPFYTCSPKAMTAIMSLMSASRIW